MTTSQTTGIWAQGERTRLKTQIWGSLRGVGLVGDIAQGMGVARGRTPRGRGRPGCQQLRPLPPPRARPPACLLLGFLFLKSKRPLAHPGHHLEPGPVPQLCTWMDVSALPLSSQLPMGGFVFAPFLPCSQSVRPGNSSCMGAPVAFAESSPRRHLAWRTKFSSPWKGPAPGCFLPAPGAWG